MDTARVTDGLPSFAHVLRLRAAEEPDRVTFTFLGEREGESASMTNAELDRRARAIAARLQQVGARGERALILLPPGLDYIAAFYGALYAGAAAVPAYPPGLASFARSLARTESIARDARPRFILTSAALMGSRELIVERSPLLGEPSWIDVGALPRDIEREWKEPPLRPEALAFLQYTSGSTGRPKGVMVSHRNLLHNTEQMRRLLRGGPDDRHCGWLPPYHDMGLVAGILMVSQFGMSVTLMSPLSFIKHPYRWVKTLTDIRATITGGAPFGFDLVARKITDEQLETLDLSTIRVACIAAEPVRQRTLDAFMERFGPVGWRPEAFLPCYGLAETTLMATGGTAVAHPVIRRFERSAFLDGRLEPARATGGRCFSLVGNGPPIDGMDVIVVDPKERRLRSDGELGEVWACGESVALGYWEKPEQNERLFGATLLDPHEAELHPGPFLRTGDIGAFVDGELIVAGRIKDVMIVDGTNHHPEDLEETVTTAHPALRFNGGAVFSVDDGVAERVVVVHEVLARGLEPEDVVSKVRQAVAEEHGIDLSAVALIRARTIPKTPSAKIQRHVCREAYRKGDLVVLHEWKNPRAKSRASASESAVPEGEHR